MPVTSPLPTGPFTTGTGTPGADMAAVRAYLTEKGNATDAELRAEASATYVRLDRAAVAAAEASALLGLVPRKRMESPPSRVNVKASGINSAPIAAGGTGYAINDLITIAGGTASNPGVLRVTGVSAGAVTTAAIATAGVYTVNAVNPAGQSSSTGAGTGATFNLSFGGLSASSIIDAVNIPATDARMRFTGAGPQFNISSTFFFGQTAGSNTACTWEWTTDSTTVEVRQLGNNTGSVVYVDGVQVEQPPVQTDPSGAGYVYILDFGGAPRMRNFKLVSVNAAFGGLWVTKTAVTPTFRSAPKSFAFGLGDSYMFGTGAENLATQAFVNMCDALNLDFMPDGVGGAGWTSGAALTPSTRVTNKSALTRVPDVVFLDMGYNDAGATSAAIAVGFDGAVAAVRSQWPAARIIAFGPATPVGDTTALSAVRETLRTRAAAATPPVPFIDASDFVTAATAPVYTNVDNVHPSFLGHRVIGARKAAAARPLLAP